MSDTIDIDVTITVLSTHKQYSVVAVMQGHKELVRWSVLTETIPHKYRRAGASFPGAGVFSWSLPIGKKDRTESDVVVYLRVHGPAIGQLVQECDPLSKKLVSDYSFWCRCPQDAMAYTILEATLAEFRESHRDLI